MPETTPQQLPTALCYLHQFGSITLLGTNSTAQRKVDRVRKVTLIVFLSCVAFGIVALAAGSLLREVGVWALAILVGIFVLFLGLVGTIVLVIVISLHRYRTTAEHHPVVLRPDGIWMRGIGPIGWHEVQPPAYKWILSKNDITGKYAVMPLTEAGLNRINNSWSSQSLLVGPVPYLKFEIPYLLLPGIAGFSEDDTVQLFQAAYAMFAPRSNTRHEGTL